MSTAKKRMLKIAAWMGWGATVGILIGIAFEVEIVIAKSLFFGRVFALLGLVSAVITLGLWNERARARNVIPVEEAWKIGAAFGVNYAQTMTRLTGHGMPASQMPDLGEIDWDTLLRMQVDQDGRQDTPPIKWPPRR